jgi:hypothetical protein
MNGHAIDGDVPLDLLDERRFGDGMVPAARGRQRTRMPFEASGQ